MNDKSGSLSKCTKPMSNESDQQTETAQWLDYTWPIPQITNHENFLRCPICHELFTAAMTFNVCSHTFCSLCIRRALEFRTTCPLCHTSVSSSCLYNNHLVDNLVQSFVELRPMLASSLENNIVVGRGGGGGEVVRKSSTSVLRPNEVSMFMKTSSVNEVVVASRPLGSSGNSSVRVENSSSKMRKRKRKEIDESNEVEVDVDLTKDTAIVCPSCNKRFSSDQMRLHVNSCLDENIIKNVQPVSFKTASPEPTSARSPLVSTKRIVAPVYGLMSLKNLRDTLRKCGLNEKGEKDDLVWRHKEYVLQYNANLDSLNPKSNEQVIAIVKRNEELLKQPTKVVQSKKKSQKSIMSMFSNSTPSSQESKPKAGTTKATFCSIIAEIKSRKTSSIGTLVNQENSISSESQQSNEDGSPSTQETIDTLTAISLVDAQPPTDEGVDNTSLTDITESQANSESQPPTVEEDSNKDSGELEPSSTATSSDNGQHLQAEEHGNLAQEAEEDTMAMRRKRRRLRILNRPSLSSPSTSTNSIADTATTISDTTMANLEDASTCGQNQEQQQEQQQEQLN